jgi:hypothetical protein
VWAKPVMRGRPAWGLTPSSQYLAVSGGRCEQELRLKIGGVGDGGGMDRRGEGERVEAPGW